MTDSAATPDLVELAEAYGITTEYEDWKKARVSVAADTLVAVLAALDVDASTPDAVRSALQARRDAAWRRVVPPCVVVREGDDVEFPVHVAEGDQVAVHVVTEVGAHVSVTVSSRAQETREVDGRVVERHVARVDGDLPLGYHTVTVSPVGLAAGDGDSDDMRVDGDDHPSTEAGDGHDTRAAGARASLVVTPRVLEVPATMRDKRVWGLATQLYSVRSKGSWGVGDLVDLRDLAVWSAAEHGADYVLVNPLHAAQPSAPMEPSPYLPTSRRFVNPLYLRVEHVEEYASAAADVRGGIDDLARDVHARLDDVDRIDRDAAWGAKEQALRVLWQIGRTPGRQAAFDAYCRAGGEQLTRFATWCVLFRTFGPDWRTWPHDYQDATAPAVARFGAEHADEVDFHRWLQWCLDEQLRGVQSDAVAAGMALGVVHDLAVGVNPAGADAWAMQDAFAAGIHVGAPPDQFTQLGQDWGQPPLRPDRLAETAYAPFREIVGTVLRHAGGVRIDHILGLFRLWWVPESMTPKDGTYVTYDHEAMIGILVLEAQRAGALVVGEDLGTLEAWVQTFLAERGVYGTSILWFEQDWDAQRPLPPEDWREKCLASVTTHDLPPTAGYLDAAHVRLRHELGLLDGSLEDELARDEADRRRWREFLVAQGLLDDADAPNEQVVEALHAFLVTTPSRMLNVALVDAVGDVRVQNQPGTADEYPNWRVPLSGPDGEPIRHEDVFTSERAARLCGIFAGLNEHAAQG